MVPNRPTRRVVAGLAVLGVLGLAVLPQEHVHASHDGEHPDVIHRHLAPHHLFEHDTTVDHSDDDDARYLSAAFIAPGTVSRVDQDPSFVIADLPAVRPAQTRWRTLSFLNVRVHDPPWRTASGPRAPPTPLV